MCHRLPILNTETFKEDFYNVSIQQQTDQTKHWCQTTCSFMGGIEKTHLKYKVKGYLDSFASTEDINKCTW